MGMPLCVFAQYNPTDNGGVDGVYDVAPHVMRFGVQAFQFIIGAWAVYLLLFFVLATILYFTSGGDEDRMDTAMVWWKKSVVGLIVALVAFLIVDVLGDVLPI